LRSSWRAIAINANAHYQYGMALRDEGKQVDALRELIRTVELNSSHTEACREARRIIAHRIPATQDEF
jgi:hypothetical protein